MTLGHYRTHKLLILTAQCLSCIQYFRGLDLKEKTGLKPTASLSLLIELLCCEYSNNFAMENDIIEFIRTNKEGFKNIKNHILLVDLF